MTPKVDIFAGYENRRTVVGYTLRQGTEVAEIHFPTGTPNPTTRAMLADYILQGFAVTAIHYRPQ